MTEEQIKNKELCERYPFLIVRNRFSGEIPEDYDYSYIEGIGEIPSGWNKLFLQLCEDVRQPLLESNFLEEFRFSQIKEKYNRLCCYNFGAPGKVHDIIHKYEYVSQFICQKCGKPAEYETQGWYAGFCKDCLEGIANIEHCEEITFDPIMIVERYEKGEKSRIEIDCSDIWNRLYGNE